MIASFCPSKHYHQPSQSRFNIETIHVALITEMTTLKNHYGCWRGQTELATTNLCILKGHRVSAGIMCAHFDFLSVSLVVVSWVLLFSICPQLASSPSNSIMFLHFSELEVARHLKIQFRFTGQQCNTIIIQASFLDMICFYSLCDYLLLLKTQWYH